MHERLHVADPRGRIEDRLPGRRLSRGCQWPGAGFGHPLGRPEPSVAWPRVDHRLAAAFPAAIPCVLNGPVGIAASEAA